MYLRPASGAFDAEADFQVRFRQDAGTPLRPFDEAGGIRAQVVPDAHPFQFFRVVQAVEIEVKQGPAGECVLLHQGEGRALHGPLKSRGPEAAADEGGLAGAEVTPQKYQAARRQAGIDPRGPFQGGGFVLEYRGHRVIPGRYRY